VFEEGDCSLVAMATRAAHQAYQQQVGGRAHARPASCAPCQGHWRGSCWPCSRACTALAGRGAGQAAAKRRRLGARQRRRCRPPPASPSKHLPAKAAHTSGWHTTPAAACWCCAANAPQDKRTAPGEPPASAPQTPNPPPLPPSSAAWRALQVRALYLAAAPLDREARRG
jgi:hypothetical protein